MHSWVEICKTKLFAHGHRVDKLCKVHMLMSSFIHVGGTWMVHSYVVRPHEQNYTLLVVLMLPPNLAAHDDQLKEVSCWVPSC
jgi:Na+-transporting NADH:ubiquinone oxidoreductase subunit NqrB